MKYREIKSEALLQSMDNVASRTLCKFSGGWTQNPIMGGRTYQCPECGHEKTITYTCNCKFCTSCGKKNTDQFVLDQQAVLPTGRWQQVTYTLPDDLWPIFKYNRALLGDLCRIAIQTLLEQAEKKGIIIGVMAVIHTFGRDLKWNAHIHIAVTLYGLAYNHTHIKHISFAKQRVRRQFQARVTELLRETYHTLRLPHHLKQVGATAKTWTRWLDQQYRKHWHIEFSTPTTNPKVITDYLSRYLKRPPLAQSRIISHNKKEVVYQYFDHHTKTHKVYRCSPQDFLLRVVQHIPEKHFRMVRYAGFFANRVRGQLLPKLYELIEQIVTAAPQLTFRALWKMTFRNDPLSCMMCGTEMELKRKSRCMPLWKLMKLKDALIKLKPIPTLP